MKDRILNWCRTLANSQGFYGRLLNELESDPDALNELAKNNFTDMLDFILFVES